MRSIILFFAACGLAQSTAHADNAKSVFDTLFAPKLKAVAGTTDRGDDLALAKDMLALAKTSADQPGLVVHLCESAHDLAARTAEGYATAAEAMTLLAETVEAKRTAAHEKLIALLMRQASTGKPEERDGASEALIALLLTIGDEKFEKKQYPEAAADFRRAMTIATQKKSESLDEAKAKLELAMARERTIKRLATLQEKLLKDATDSATAEEIVKVYVIELDDPEAARPYLERAKSAELKTVVPLAAKPLAELTAEEALRLGEWYKPFADSARGADAQALLSRSAELLERFLELYASGGIQRAKAEVMLKDLKTKLAAIEKAAAGSARTSPRSKPAKSSSLTIVSARYGAEGGWVDLTKEVRGMAKDGRLAITADNYWAGRDPRPFVGKKLEVRYKFDNGQELTKEVPEHQLLAIIAPVKSGGDGSTVILEAKYGAVDKWIDVTQTLRDRINDGKLSAQASSSHLGVDDPINGYRKALVIFFISEGKSGVKLCYDGDSVSVP